MSLVELCTKARESCYARRCASCKWSVKGFPQCMDHHFAETLFKNGVSVQEGASDEQR